MEALRYLPFLSEDGCVITNSEPFVNIKNYPDMDKVMAEIGKIKNRVVFNSNEVAKKVNARSNMVLLGAAVPYLGIAMDKLEAAIHHIFDRKGEAVVKANLDAIHAGFEATK